MYQNHFLRKKKLITSSYYCFFENNNRLQFGARTKIIYLKRLSKFFDVRFTLTKVRDQ